MEGEDCTFDKVPFYEGKDPRLQEKPWCAACHSRPDAGLSCCARCHTAWYCNSKCQKDHYIAEHKSTCLRIAKDLKNMEDAKEAVSNKNFAFNSVPRNSFEIYAEVGRHTEPYRKARFVLAESYFRAAFEVEIKAVWEKALFHVLELLRIDASDLLDVDRITPFILLFLNRDDDAFDFIRYTINSVMQKDMTEIVAMHQNTKEGEWIYPREKNCRFLDVFEECPTLNDQILPLTFFVSLLLIKLRLVAAYDATCQAIDLVFDETIGGRRIRSVKSVVTKMLIDERMDIERQREQVEKLLDLIDRKNAYMLPAIINPSPIIQQGRPQLRYAGHPSEVYDVLIYCQHCFLRVPGAPMMLQERFGWL